MTKILCGRLRERPKFVIVGKVSIFYRQDLDASESALGPQMKSRLVNSLAGPIAAASGPMAATKASWWL